MSDNKFMACAVEIADLVKEKNLAYGDSANKSAAYMKLLYPDGVKPEQYHDMLLLVRDFDKSMRIATSKHAFGESPWRDKMGYALLAVELSKGSVELSKENKDSVVTKEELLDRHCSNCKHDDKSRLDDEPCDECTFNSHWEPITHNTEDYCLVQGKSCGNCSLKCMPGNFRDECIINSFKRWKGGYTGVL